jgi:hypothetical protein
MSETKSGGKPGATETEELSEEDLKSVDGGRGVITLNPTVQKGLISPNDISLGGPDTLTIKQ